MKEKLLKFINAELERLRDIEPIVPDTIEDDSEWDGVDCYTDGHNDGKIFAYQTIKERLEDYTD